MADENKRGGSGLPWVLLALTLVAALAAGWWFWKQREADQLNREDLSRALVEATRARTETEAKNVALRGDLDRLAQERDALTTKTSELASTLEQREAELKRLTATSKSLEEKLAAEIKRGDVKVTQSEGRIQVDLIDKVLFDSAQADVSSRGEEVLTRLGAILKDIDDRQIQISGHTDDSPITLPDLKAKFATNWELSVARAVNVVRFLSEKAGVKPARLSAAGYGQYRPVAGNITPRGRAANRRIEVLLLPPIEARKVASPAAK